MHGFKAELIRRTLRRGELATALRIGLRALRSRTWHTKRLTFCLNARELPPHTPLAPPDFDVQSFSHWSAIEPPLQELLAARLATFAADAQQLLADGAALWVGRLAERPCGFGVSRTGPHVREYFFPLTPRCALLSHFETLRAYRGRGLYGALLTNMMHTLAQTGAERFYIDCGDWNAASARGILKTGFRCIGHGILRHNGRLVWVQETPPCAAAAPTETVRQP